MNKWMVQAVIGCVAGMSQLVIFSPANAGADKYPDKPNIIFILADDLGIDGVSCYGSDKRKTPNIDRLAESGIRFDICYASPLCGPSRGLLMTGRYAFRTGALYNDSWRVGGPGPLAANEQPMAQLMKRAGYVTGMAGKWRQIGEMPDVWGFDEYSTDDEGGGFYWKTEHIVNGKKIDYKKGTYGPDVIQKFTLDFINRNKDKRFFFYYSMHFVHTPILYTPDSAVQKKDKSKNFYNDNIAYMDKQVGELVAELERLGLRKNTLLVFSGDNGTQSYNPCTVHGRDLLGTKGHMTEGGARVPLIVNWPGVAPAGKVSQDIIGFADFNATFADIAGAKVKDGFSLDGQSILPLIKGEEGNLRPYVYVQLDRRWYVREQKYKMNEGGELFDMSDAPYAEKLIDPQNDTSESKAARTRLSNLLAQLDPGNGMKDDPERPKKKDIMEKLKNKEKHRAIDIDEDEGDPL